MDVDIYRDKIGEWRFRKVYGNQERSGDGYGSPSSAERGYIDELQGAIDAGFFFVDDYQNIHIDKAAINFRRIDPTARKTH